MEKEIDKDLSEEEEVDEEEEEVEEEPDEADESEEEEEDEPGDDPYADLSHEDAIKRLKKAEKAIAKHKKHKGKGKAPKQPKEPTTKQPDDTIPEWGQKIIQSEEKRSFGYEHQLSPEQVDAVFRYNGGKVPNEKVLKRPEVKAMVKALQSKDRVAANTPKGGTGVVYKGKTFSEVTTDPKASKADKQGAFDATRKRHNVG